VVGVGIGALIHNWIPTEWIQLVLGKNNPFSVLLATAIGIPMYADIFGTIPVAEALFTKGRGCRHDPFVHDGCHCTFAPSMIMLKKVLKTKLLVTFIAIVSIGIVIIGYAFNALGFLFI
jgi:Predicted permeases